MGNNVLRAVSIINFGLKDCYLLFRDLSPSQAADELLRLPTEHAAAYDFYPPGVLWNKVLCGNFH